MFRSEKLLHVSFKSLRVDCFFSLEAPSKDAVREVCVQSQRGLSQRLTESTAATLGISEGQAAQVTQKHQCVLVLAVCVDIQ